MSYDKLFSILRRKTEAKIKDGPNEPFHPNSIVVITSSYEPGHYQFGDLDDTQLMQLKTSFILFYQKGYSLSANIKEDYKCYQMRAL